MKDRVLEIAFQNRRRIDVSNRRDQNRKAKDPVSIFSSYICKKPKRKKKRYSKQCFRVEEESMFRIEEVRIEKQKILFQSFSPTFMKKKKKRNERWSARSSASESKKNRIQIDGSIEAGSYFRSQDLHESVNSQKRNLRLGQVFNEKPFSRTTL